MRYALRKQAKIASVYSEDYLNEHIIKSLTAYFSKQEDEEMLRCIKEADTYDFGEMSYPLLRINDLSDGNAMLEFAIIGQQYDVLKLSFLGRIKG